MPKSVGRIVQRQDGYRISDQLINRVNCSKCQSVFDIATPYIGSSFICKFCGASVVVPQEYLQEYKSKATTTGSTSIIVSTCPHCNAKVDPLTFKNSKDSACPYCYQNIEKVDVAVASSSSGNQHAVLWRWKSHWRWIFTFIMFWLISSGCASIVMGHQDHNIAKDADKMVSLFLMILMIISATTDRQPRSLIKKILWVILWMFLYSTVAGFLGFLFGGSAHNYEEVICAQIFANEICAIPIMLDAMRRSRLYVEEAKPNSS